MAEARDATLRRNVTASVIGNILEWYDFAVYGFLAPIMGSLFFPADDRLASLLAAFGVFAVGYAARPLGGAIFGHIGDRFGRKPALILSISVMGLATLGIALLPVYAQLGGAAAALLVVLRVAQGISVGGEFAGSIVFIAEHAPPEKRGLFDGLPQAGGLMGFLMGSGIAALTAALVGEAAMHDWGWRVPFLMGAVIALLGLVLRCTLTEPLATRHLRHGGVSPVVVLLRGHWPTLLQMIFLIMAGSIGSYMMFVYAASYLTAEMHVSTARALEISTLGLALMLLLTLPAARLSDRIGRRPTLAFAILGLLLLSWPLFWLMHQDSLVLILAGQLGFALFLGVYLAVIPAATVEMLPTDVRCSGMAVGSNLVVGLFGGTTPLVATYLVARTADDFAPVYYVMAVSLLALAALLALKERAREPLLS